MATSTKPEPGDNYKGSSPRWRSSPASKPGSSRKRASERHIEQSPQVREFALLVVAKYGDRSHLKILDPLLCDTSSSDSSSGFRKSSRVEVRDVALATMIHLSGQKLKDFGFEKAGENFFERFDVDSLGFSTDAKRQTALAKWRVWERLQKDDK